MIFSHPHNANREWRDDEQHVRAEGSSVRAQIETLRADVNEIRGRR